MKNEELIRCNFCGKFFYSVESFERHIDKCDNRQNSRQCLIIEDQVIYPNGKIERRRRKLKRRMVEKSTERIESQKLPSDDFLQRDKSDEEFTECDFL